MEDPFYSIISRAKFESDWLPTVERFASAAAGEMSECKLASLEATLSEWSTADREPELRGTGDWLPICLREGVLFEARASEAVLSRARWTELKQASSSAESSIGIFLTEDVWSSSEYVRGLTLSSTSDWESVLRRMKSGDQVDIVESNEESYLVVDSEGRWLELSLSGYFYNARLILFS